MCNDQERDGPKYIMDGSICCSQASRKNDRAADAVLSWDSGACSHVETGALTQCHDKGPPSIPCQLILLFSHHAQALSDSFPILKKEGNTGPRENEFGFLAVPSWSRGIAEAAVSSMTGGNHQGA